MLHTSVTCLFCEDIREEKKNTDTIIGVMPDNIRVAQVPGLFTRIALYVRIQSPVDDPPPSISLRLELPDGESIDLSGMPQEEITKAVETARQNEAPYIGIIIKAIMGNVSIKSAGRLSAIARLGDKDYLAGTLNVKVEEAPPAAGEELSTDYPRPAAANPPTSGRST